MGRTPINQVPMTNAEKMKAYRQRKKANGQIPISLSFSESELNKIDELVDFFELPNRTVAMQDLLKLPLLEAIESMVAAKENLDYQRLSQISDDADRKVFSDIKSIMWKAIILRSKEVGDLLTDSLKKHFG